MYILSIAYAEIWTRHSTKNVCKVLKVLISNRNAVNNIVMWSGCGDFLLCFALPWTFNLYDISTNVCLPVA